MVEIMGSLEAMSGPIVGVARAVRERCAAPDSSTTTFVWNDPTQTRDAPWDPEASRGLPGFDAGPFPRRRRREPSVAQVRVIHFTSGAENEPERPRSGVLKTLEPAVGLEPTTF